MVYDVAANWKLIIHNYSECLHCPGVHPALQKLSHYLSGENEPASQATWAGGCASVKESAHSRSMARMRRECLPGVWKATTSVTFISTHSCLTCCSASIPDYVMVHTLWPRGAGRTEIICELLFHPDVLARPDFDPGDAFEFWDLTNRQDWHVCEQMQLGVQSRAYRPGPYSHREELLYGFDRLIVEAERKAGGGTR